MHPKLIGTMKPKIEDNVGPDGKLGVGDVNRRVLKITTRSSWMNLVCMTHSSTNHFFYPLSLLFFTFLLAIFGFLFLDLLGMTNRYNLLVVPYAYFYLKQDLHLR